MIVGIIKNELAVRVLSDKMQAIIALPYMRPMDFTKKTMKEFVCAGLEGFENQGQFQKMNSTGSRTCKK